MENPQTFDWTPGEHRAAALALLFNAQGLGYTSPARASLLAEGQLHATLALSAPPAKAPEPDPMPTARELLDAAPKKPTARRKKAPEPVYDEIVPGSEEDLIRQEAAQ